MEAVLALIFRNDKIIAVSRKDNPDDFGLIGGKVEENESHVHALYREVEEETGLRLIHGKKVFVRYEKDFKVTTYLCEAEGEIKTNEKGVVKEVTWEELFNSTFGNYNRNLYNSLFKK